MGEENPSKIRDPRRDNSLSIARRDSSGAGARGGFAGGEETGEEKAKELGRTK